MTNTWSLRGPAISSSAYYYYSAASPRKKRGWVAFCIVFLPARKIPRPRTSKKLPVYTATITDYIEKN